MKVDNMKRNTSKQYHRENHISCWRKSGLAQKQYCLNQGIAIPIFSYWLRKFDQESENLGSPRFYPLTVKDSPASPSSKGFHTGVRLSFCDDKYKIDLENEFSETTLTKLITFLETI
ncbi:MAG: hypothetical protein COA36_13100 [Desulfotalea sp.]|nr:MAG: hypothetical protein COA36_13100 [Desulfotalea sp.]